MEILYTHVAPAPKTDASIYGALIQCQALLGETPIPLCGAEP